MLSLREFRNGTKALKTAPSADEILWFFLETPDIYGTFASQVISVIMQLASEA